MSQLPPPPQGMGPGDFAPIGTPVGPGAPLPPRPRTNGWAITSLISGLLGCVPYATGFNAVIAATAVITGIVGLKKANDPRYSTGRGLAIGGIVLGSLSLVFWLFFGTLFIGLFTATGQPRALAQQFVKMTSEGAIDAAMEHTSPMFGRARVERLAEQMQEWGAYQDVTSYNPSVMVTGSITTCELKGTATFADEERPFVMTLVKEGDAWKVSGLEFE